MAGEDARDFKVQADNSEAIIIPPKSTISLGIEFKSRFIRPADATLILASHRSGASLGSTLAFRVMSAVDNIKPSVSEPCHFEERRPPASGARQASVIVVRVGLPGAPLDSRRSRAASSLSE